MNLEELEMNLELISVIIAFKVPFMLFKCSWRIIRVVLYEYVEISVLFNIAATLGKAVKLDQICIHTLTVAFMDLNLILWFHYT